MAGYFFLKMNRVKLLPLAIFILIVLLLDFAAFDDITTGRQPHYIFEYATLIVSAPVLLVLGYKIYKLF